MQKLDKQQIAIFLFIGLVVVGIIMYSVSLFSPKTTNETTEEGNSVMFSAPKETELSKDKEKYKSSLDVYEQEHKQEVSEREPVSFSFEKDAKKPDQLPTESQPIATAPISNTNKPIIKQSSIAKAPKNQIQEVAQSEEEAVIEEEPEEPVRTRKKGMLSASKVDGNETESQSKETDSHVTFPIVFHGDQSVTPGRRVKLRVTKAFDFHGSTIPAGTIILANTSFNGDYVYININSIDVDGEPVSCNFTGYKNGQMGIYAPSNENKEILNDNINSNANRGVRVSLGTTSVQTGGLSKKTSAKEKQVSIPSQFSMIFIQGQSQ